MRRQQTRAGVEPVRAQEDTARKRNSACPRRPSVEFERRSQKFFDGFNGRLVCGGVVCHLGPPFHTRIGQRKGNLGLRVQDHAIFALFHKAVAPGLRLREPERLMGFVHTVVRRQVAAQIDRAVQGRREQVDMDLTVTVTDARQTPEEEAIFREHQQVAEKVLRSVSTRDREILTRFYLMEQTQAEICEEMGLSETQFRLLKSRAKARFGELGKKRLARGHFV